MPSRKPDFHLSISERDRTHFQPLSSAARSPLSPRSPRSPRFLEDFDAPFSEALLNASRTTLATDSTASYEPSSQSRISFDAESKRHASTSAGASSKAPAQSPSSPQLRQDSWTSESTRRSRINERIREWAKKSFVFSRKDSEQPDHVDSDRRHCQQSKPAGVNPAPDNIDTGTKAAPEKPEQAMVAVTEADDPR